jgi:phosphatidylinositol glycan class B
LAAFFSKGYHHFDEHFQIIEMANYKLGKVPFDEMPWELGHKMRPALQPMLAYYSIKAFNSLGLQSPFAIATFLRLLSAAFAVFVYFLFYRHFKKEFKEDRFLSKGFLILSFLLWYLIYNGVRFSSENWSALFFALAYYLYFKANFKKWGRFLLIGLCFGLAFSIRYQTAIMTMGFMAWMLLLNKERISALFTQLLGVIAGIAIGILADTWFYEEWTFSSWNYLDQNILQNKVNNFVIRSWTFYFSRFFSQGIPPVSIISMLSVLAFFFFKPRHAVTWIFIPFLLVHFVIGHKELRFLFSLLPFLPYLIIKVLAIAKEKWSFMEKPWMKVFLKFSLGVNLLFVLVACFRPADPYMSFYEFAYKEMEGKPSALYYIKNNPYHRITSLYFYRPENLEIQEWSPSLLERHSDRERYLVLRGKATLPEELASLKPIYSTFPSWMQRFNFNKWQEKSGSIKLYHLKE